MKTEWDYSDLAVAYLKRPDYADSVLDEIVKRADLTQSSQICDVGAGVAHLTLAWLKRGYTVTAVEPNDEMRRLGIERTKDSKKVKWIEATGEATTCPSNTYDLVSFGSSFNVTNRRVALKETIRILKDRGWFTCLWNHRDLEDPIQAKIESIISSLVSEYSYGTRREDQTDEINKSGLFEKVAVLEGRVTQPQSIVDCVEAWKSHATLQRQAGAAFPEVIKQIESMLLGLNQKEIQIPYTTRVWMAQKK